MPMTAGSERRVNKQKMRRWSEDVKVGSKTAEFQQRAGKGFSRKVTCDGEWTSRKYEDLSLNLQGPDRVRQISMYS